jgi:uncharacterized protein DUF4160
MPELSRFFGIVITMNFDDHVPPHFHVRHGERYATINIATANIHDGGLGPRALGMVQEWTRLHRAELMHNWRRAQRHESLRKIPPLE